ncbi:MAG: hypothetical protein EWV92_13010 [Microcystis aeruginosa Ma_MB_S_20031200_S102]|uniref:Uncharacterized protein n=1 Tax=Microcystis aeruginosa Ma_MB_S_20031200_S102 TaxID=2486254 RepID=A0A552EN93_MICAE|nr:MAG: hypothetical protein EWV79_11440 [Microcystis aeruginosa Ma_MB_S_20031200_S102D]TRU35939.1 MAG: hypothetical protein EWV92_13010 [Microcystis aeruginosa Ma_MB_S_20031200_S102]
MIFEFVMVYQQDSDTDIRQILIDTLTTSLQDNYDEFEPDTVEQMIIFQTQRIANQSTNQDGNTTQTIILGFTLDLPEEVNEAQTVVEEFAKALTEETTPISHIVKFEDSLLQADLARWSAEIFAIEMKLRRVLTLIYLNAYQGLEPYKLLKDEKEQIATKEKPTDRDMQDNLENQFFHLLFSQYVNLNQRPDLKVSELLEKIRNFVQYEELQTEINRKPVQDSDDADFLAGLKNKINAIEKMRNCIAHHRRPSKTTKESYEKAEPEIKRFLDNYLSQFRWQETSESEP